METGPQTGPEVSKMTTDRFFEAECPHPDNEANKEEEVIKNCSGCALVIRERWENVAFFSARWAEEIPDVIAWQRN